MLLPNILKFTSKSTSKGFTLIELLIVIAVISTLAVAVFTALNPSQRLKDSKDARRTSDVDTILTAIHAAIVDNKGTLPTNLAAAGATEVQLGTAAAGAGLVQGGCNVIVAAATDLMTGSLNLSKYLKSMPVSPPKDAQTFSPALTGYSVQVDANGIVTIRACGTEGATNISASR